MSRLLFIGLLCSACSANLARGVAPELTGVQPPTGPDDVQTPVVIVGRGFAVVPHVDFRTGESAVDAGFRAWLDESPLLDVAYRDAGSLTATVPAGLAAGAHDLLVTAPGGHSATLAAAFTVTGGNTDWWDPAFPVRHRITFDNTAQTTDDLFDFPALVTLAAPPFESARAAPAGDDLRFVDDAGAALAHEIEAWNPGARSAVWVRVPYIPAGSADTSVWLYYGEPAAASTARPAAVWSNGFAGVYHLDHDLLDSSANDNHGVDGGSSAGPGRVAGGRWFDFGQADSVEVTDVGFPLGAAPRTLCAWANSPMTVGGFHWTISYGRFTGQGGFFIGRRDAGLWCGGVFNDIIAANVFLPDTWVYTCCTHDGTNANLYVDGALAAGPEDKSLWSVESDRALLGDHINSGESWDGGLDEARISMTARSADWIAASHATMTGGFTTVGPAELLE